MRALAIIPFLCLVAAFILSMLLMFAGSKVGFLEQYDLLTLNTSQIGQVDLESTLARLDLPDTVTSAINTFTALPGGEARAHDIIASVARALNIHDYYSLHVLDYCEGYYEPTGRANASFTPTKNTTFCADTTTAFTFNITQILARELRAGTTLADLNWPTDIQNALDALNYAARAMFVLYCIGIGLTGLAMLTALGSVFAHGVLHAWLNGLLDLLAFLAIGIASGLATGIAYAVTNAVTQFGAPIGIAAYRGNGFLGLTWAATALVLVATFAWVFDCCAGRKKSNRRSKV